MRKGEKHRVYCERGENRGAAEEREDGHGGRLEEEPDRQRERGQKEERDIVTVVGGSGCVLPAQPVGTNKRP